jgi:aryl-alcohol dehydrogenase-like predicted oxidoreductase
MTDGGVQLGVGLIRIGREWGHVRQEIPSEQAALAFLEHAVDSGIRFFDTAASYGLSEERLGTFLRSVPPDVRARLTIATKFGEHWDKDKGETYVDHSFEALQRSLDQSLERLGVVDVLQLHKTTLTVLGSVDMEQAWEYARSLGITRLGASVSDLESAASALGDRRHWCIQLPFSSTFDRFASTVDAAAARGMFLIINRPYAMGGMLYGENPSSKIEAFRYLLNRQFHGVILTGTANIRHLEENLLAFREAQHTAI